MIWDYMYLIHIIFFVMRQDLFPKLQVICEKLVANDDLPKHFCSISILASYSERI